MEKEEQNIKQYTPEQQKRIKAFAEQIGKNQPTSFSTDEGDIQLKANQQYTIIGQKNSGKSYFASYVANQFPRVVFIDPRLERFTVTDTKYDSSKAHIMPDKWLIVESAKELQRALKKGYNYIIYHPLPLLRGQRSREDMTAEIDDICQIVYDEGNITLFIDEIDGFADTYRLPDGLFNIIQYGLHKNVGLVGITRRFQQVNPAIPRLSSGFFIFRVSGKDFRYIEEFLPDMDEYEVNSYKYRTKLKYEMMTLPDWHFYWFDGLTLRKMPPVAGDLNE